MLKIMSLRSACQVVLRGMETRMMSSGPSITDTNYTQTIPIPQYNIDRPQSLENRKARLHYQSRKRGMLENDLLLSTFAKKYLDSFNEEQTMMYDRIINGPSNDWDIFYWMVGKQPTPQEYDNEVMNMLKKHAKNEEREMRFQPDLF